MKLAYIPRIFGLKARIWDAKDAGKGLRLRSRAYSLGSKALIEGCGVRTEGFKDSTGGYRVSVAGTQLMG